MRTVPKTSTTSGLPARLVEAVDGLGDQRRDDTGPLQARQGVVGRAGLAGGDGERGGVVVVPEAARLGEEGLQAGALGPLLVDGVGPVGGPEPRAGQDDRAVGVQEDRGEGIGVGRRCDHRPVDSTHSIMAAGTVGGTGARPDSERSPTAQVQAAPSAAATDRHASAAVRPIRSERIPTTRSGTEKPPR